MGGRSVIAQCDASACDCRRVRGIAQEYYGGWNERYGYECGR